LRARLVPVQAEASTEAGAALFAAADFVAVGEADAFVAFAVGEALAEDGEGLGVAVVALGVGDAVGDGIGSGNSSASTCGAASGDETTAGALGATAASGGWVAHAAKSGTRATRATARRCDMVLLLGRGSPRQRIPDSRLRSNLDRCRGRRGRRGCGGAVGAFAELLANQTRVLGVDHPRTLRVRSQRVFRREKPEHLNPGIGKRGSVEEM
jgi:hypothetical protein